MQSIREIFEQETVVAMVPMIIDYYRTHLDIHVTTKRYGSLGDDAEENIGYQYALHSTKKLPKHSFDGHSHRFPMLLDTGECTSLVTTHFSGVLKGSSEDLHTMKNFLTALKKRFLRKQDIDDYPEAAITLRFVESLTIAVNLKIRDHLLQAWSHASSRNPQLLQPLLQQINQLELLIPELNLEDLLTFKELVMRQHTSLKTEDVGNDEEMALTRTENALDTVINNELIRLNLEPDPTALIVDLPNLKTQILVKKSLEASASTNYTELDAALDVSIKSVLLELLLTYEQSVASSISDMRKTKKLALIQELRQSCAEDTPLEDLYAIMQKNEQLLIADSIGQYIYACFCYLFGIKNKQPNFGITLFTAVDPKTPGTEISEGSGFHTQVKRD